MKIQSPNLHDIDRRPPQARARCVPFALLAALFGAIACGGPRPDRTSAPPPPYPPPVFDDTLAGPELLGATLTQVRAGRPEMDRMRSRRSDELEFVEYLSNHAYILAVHFHFSVGPISVLKRLQYELTPALQYDASLNQAFLNGVVRRFGMPVERPTQGRHWYSWRPAGLLLRWQDVRLELRPHTASPSPSPSPSPTSPQQNTDDTDERMNTDRGPAPP